MSYKRKTKSSVKKRMRVTGNGTLKRAYACKRHGLRKRSQEMKRSHRGMVAVNDSDAKNVIKHFIPYGL